MLQQKLQQRLFLFDLQMFVFSLYVRIVSHILNAKVVKRSETTNKVAEKTAKHQKKDCTRTKNNKITNYLQI